ncbi:hypothetical protein DSO57_1029695 [Entomophthora muscae]|uniref:Uncharacterized protein n=1 Tax=Entomophthora muscae TaxID=34485 RepID=A0ACC2RFW7_9FUNG|nr:hypothetical protein DSO57_1029695 [Entomophthora muscae]
MARVTNKSSSSDQNIRPAKQYDPLPPKKPNRKFQLALLGLNKQLDRPKLRQAETPEARPEQHSEPRNDPKPTFAPAARPVAPPEPTTYSFVRSSPKLSPPDTPSSEPSRATSSRPSGYQSSPLGQQPSSSKGLSFVRGGKPDADKPRPSGDGKDRPALASSGHFIRSISSLNSQRSRESRPSTPYDRPSGDGRRARPATIVKPKSPPTTSSSEATPPQPSPPQFKPSMGLKPKAEEVKPTVSILDRLGSSKRKISRSPSPEKSAKREKLAPAPKPKPAPQITSRLGPMPNQGSRPAPLSNQVVRSRQGSYHDTHIPRHPPHGRSEHGWRPHTHSHPQAPYQYHRNDQYQHNEQYHRNEQYQHNDYPAHMNQANHSYNHGANSGYGGPQSTVPIPYGHPGYVYTFKPTSQRRCTYFPRCTRGDCMFFHPTKDCPNSNECQDMECLFIHPSDMVPVMCHFDLKCTREDCFYTHKERRFVVSDPYAFLAIRCRGECLGRSCKKLHDESKLPHELTMCLFAHRCNRPPCFFVHLSHYRKNIPRKDVRVPDLIDMFQGLMMPEED